MKTFACATILAAILSAVNSIQVNQILREQRAQVQWRHQYTNKFTWKATQELKWTVVNAFIDT